MIAAVALLSACGTGNPASEQSATAGVTSASSTPPVTTTQGKQATVAQYASLVAKQRAKMGPRLDEMLSNHCDWSTPGNVDARPGYVTCGIGVSIVGIDGQLLRMALEGAQAPEHPDYIGAAPNEITSIVADTIAASKTLESAGKTAEPCAIPAAAADGCIAALFQLDTAMTDMQSQFAAWGPYGA